MKTKTWQSILAGERRSSSIIKEEIRNLTNSGQELQEALPGLEKTLEEARKGLLAESIGAIEKVNQAETAISGSKNRLAGLSSILEDLNAALKEALASEKTTRLQEIVSEVARIDKEATEKRLEIVELFAKAASLYANVTGSEPSRFCYDFFLNYRIDGELRRCIAENSSDEVSLYRKRENLQNEAIRLRKNS